MRSRGISDKFAAKFVEDGYLAFCQDHEDELILGVRDGAVNLYLNCASISKVAEKTRGPLTGLINMNHFQPKGKWKGRGEYRRITLGMLVAEYNGLKAFSDKNSGKEEKAQSQLYLDNNANTDSEWFCFDLEYVQSHTNYRFDILAISKKKDPLYKVAVIEVKYEKEALKGRAGVRKHIKDFYEFQKDKDNGLDKEEVCNVIKSLQKLGVKVPESLHGITPDEIDGRLEFYVITLNNKKPSNGGSTSKQIMGGQLFRKEDNKWKSRAFSSILEKEGDIYDLMGHDPKMAVTFLFSDSDLESLNIQDIIEDHSYDRVVIRGKR